jgi:subtilase family serine protease
MSKQNNKNDSLDAREKKLHKEEIKIKKEEKRLRKFKHDLKKYVKKIINNEDKSILGPLIPNINVTNYRKILELPEEEINNIISPNEKVHYLQPYQLTKIYGLDSISLPNSALRGTGITVAVIIAYHYANLQSDFNKFNSTFGLPGTTLNIINLAGNVTDSGWALECCLDVQMVHTIAPGANIMVVEAKSSSLLDLMAAINYANNSGANVVSMSWGSNEFIQQTSFDSYFSHPNVTYLASSGDNNFVSYPSSSANVVSIGGTTLSINPNNTRLSESTWQDAGSGMSRFVNKPIYQNNILAITGNKRVTPDISLVANPNSGVLVYSSAGGTGNYYIVGGTSASCPMAAGIIAVANQLRRIVNKSFLTSSANANSSMVQKYLYQTIYANNVNNTLYKSCIYDVTIGKDGRQVARVGYDFCCGLGAPNANTLCTALVNA